MMQLLMKVFQHFAHKRNIWKPSSAGPGYWNKEIVTKVWSVVWKDLLSFC